jgi:hypothetical protein
MTRFHSVASPATFGRMSTPSPVDDYHAHLHQAGWSVGDACAGGALLVSGALGENVIWWAGRSQVEVWHRTVDPLTRSS